MISLTNKAQSFLRRMPASERRRLWMASTVATAVLAGAVSIGTIKLHETQPWEAVYTNGTYVGMVPDNQQAVETVSRIANGYNVKLNLYPIHTSVTHTYDWKYVESLPTSAEAIQLNGRPLVYTSNAQQAALVLTDIEKSLLPKHIDANAKVHFIGDVKMVPTIVGISSILSPTAAERYLLHPRQKVVSGRAADMLFSPSMPRSAPLDATSLLQVKVVQSVKEPVSIPYTIQYVPDAQMGTGNVSIVTPGHAGKAVDTVEQQFVNGHLVTTRVLHREVISQPTKEVAKRGTNSGIASGSWAWPTPCYIITSPFGWRYLYGGEQFHPGIDIGDSMGTPIYATNNGTVEDAGWNSGGYGNWVKINNGNGIETVFGHMSSVVAHAGELVTKGQLIGYSGATGDATGPHLHYEVRLNGTPVSPLPYM